MIVKIILLALVLVAGFLLTTKVIPFLFVRVARMLGFAMKMTPIAQKRLARFRRIKRGYYAFLWITTLFVTSLFLELLVNTKPLLISYGDNFAMPAVKEWLNKAVFFAEINTFNRKSDFGQSGESEVDYALFRKTLEDPSLLDSDIEDARTRCEKSKKSFGRLKEPGPEATEKKHKFYRMKKESFERRKNALEELETAKTNFTEGKAWIVNTLYAHSPDELRYDDLEENPPNKPSFAQGIPLGTDVSGRDVLSLLLYGFRISITFAIVVATCGYFVGILVGGMQGYYGGWIDILSQRFVEIWGSIPFLFLIMIIGSMITPDFLILAGLMIVLRSWLGITYYVRGEFYREKAKDYVQAAIGAGVRDLKIITKHILPNALVPVVTFAPFGIVAYIGSLVSLDYLGFGLPPGTPSWGALMRQGLENMRFYPHLLIVPIAALATTLYSVVMIGEAVREAFDPKVFSRLR